MAERSVSAMRAMFEAKGENQSPPSRGRSPAGSERSNGSRNVSNIRSSFVAVEKSGQHGPMLGLRRISDAEQPADAASPSQRGRQPLSRTSSLTNVQEEEGGLGNILKGSPFEDSRKAGRSIPRSVPNTKEKENENQEKKTTQPAPVQKIAALAQGTVDKFQSTAQKPPEQKPPPISTKTAAKEKSTPAVSKTPTSATRSGPALKVSSPSTTNAPTSKPAPRKPTQPQEPKLSSRPSRPSLAAGGMKETRPKSPAKPVPKPQKASRPSLGNADPEFLSRMARPTQASALKTEKDTKAEEKKPRQSVGGKAPDSGFLERMMRPTQASASKHQEEEEAAKQAAPTKATAPTSSRVLERLMKPTQSSSSKHEKDAKPEEGKKSARNSTGGRSTEPGFLERMMRPTAASSSKHVPAEEPRTVTPPRTKTQIAAAIMKPKHKLEAAKAKVEEKLDIRKSEDDDPQLDVTPASVAPEKTQAEVEAVRPVYERVETEKAAGVPALTPGAAVKIADDEARAKRAAPVLAKESSREKALDAATPGKTEASVDEPDRPVAEKPIAQLEEEQAAAAKPKPDIVESVTQVEKQPTLEKPKPEVTKESAPAIATSTPTAPQPAKTTQVVDSAAEPVPKQAPLEVAEQTTKPVEKAAEPVNKPVEPIRDATSEAALKPEWASLKSQDTDVAPPTKTTSAGAGDAPGPALDQAAELVQEAKEEVAEQEQKREGEGHPTEAIAEAVANVQ